MELLLVRRRRVIGCLCCWLGWLPLPAPLCWLRVVFYLILTACMHQRQVYSLLPFSLSLGLCDQSGLEVWPSLLNPHQHQTSRRPAATTEWQAVWPAELLSNPLLSCCRQACMQLQFARPVNLLYVYRMDYFKVQMLC